MSCPFCISNRYFLCNARTLKEFLEFLIVSFKPLNQRLGRVIFAFCAWQNPIRRKDWKSERSFDVIVSWRWPRITHYYSCSIRIFGSQRNQWDTYVLNNVVTAVGVFVPYETWPLAKRVIMTTVNVVKRASPNRKHAVCDRKKLVFIFATIRERAQHVLSVTRSQSVTWPKSIFRNTCAVYRDYDTAVATTRSRCSLVMSTFDFGPTRFVIRNWKQS